MIDPHKVLDEAAAIIGERGKDYGGIESNFVRISIIASNAGVNIPAPDVALLMACVKLARMQTSPSKRDNYIDAINYLAFACELIGAK